MLNILLALIAMNVLSAGSGFTVHSNPHSDHLVVLTHGVMGTGQDLNYLGRLLEDAGCDIYKSTSNENLKVFKVLNWGARG